MNALLSSLTRHYPFWLVGTAVLGFIAPPTLVWFSGPWIFWGLACVMLGMGLSLKPTDFSGIVRMPRWTLMGLGFQFLLMPLTGWLVARVMGLSTDLTLGLMILASCPGGIASNMVAYLARANVALSVVMTMTSTLCSFVMTPLWCEWLAGRYVPVDGVGIALSTLKMVIAPVLIGVLCNWRFPRAVAKIERFGPPVAVIALCLITGGIVAASAETIAEFALQLTLAVTLLHGVGFALGYFASKLMRFPEQVARTVSIEVGMQNGGMAAVLAKTHFAANPMAAVPMVFSAVMQNVIGSLIGGWWAKRTSEETEGAKQ